MFPQAQIQRCVIHMLHNSFKYVNDLKKFLFDFKVVYNAPNEKAGLNALVDICHKWGRKYPYVSHWENNREVVSFTFSFVFIVRRIMYTTYTAKKLCRHFIVLSTDFYHFLIYHGLNSLPLTVSQKKKLGWNRYFSACGGVVHLLLSTFFLNFEHIFSKSHWQAILHAFSYCYCHKLYLLFLSENC